MSLRKCPQCGHDVKNDLAACPNCGFDLAESAGEVATASDAAAATPAGSTQGSEHDQTHGVASADPVTLTERPVLPPPR
jgi:hypothetical protein